MSEPCGCGAVAPGRSRRDGEPQPSDGRLRRRELRGRHLLEIARPQHLPVRPGEGGVELDLPLRLLGSRLAFGAGEERLAQPPAERLGVALRRGVNGGEEEARDPLEEFRVAPEDVERLVEQRPLVGSAYEDRVQRPVEVVAPGHPDRLDGAQCVEHRAAPQGKAGCPQGACEVHEIGAEAARDAGCRLGCGLDDGVLGGRLRWRLGQGHRRSLGGDLELHPLGRWLDPRFGQGLGRLLGGRLEPCAFGRDFGPRFWRWCL